MGSVPRPAVGVVSARLASEFRAGPCCASGARDESRRGMTRDDASEEPAWNLVESSRASSIQVRGVEEVDAVLMGGVHDDVGIGLAGDGTEIHGAEAEPAHGSRPLRPRCV